MGRYSAETAAKVEAAFRELDAQGVVITVSDIARKIGKSDKQVRRVLRDTAYWAEERKQAAKDERHRRSRAHGAETAAKVEAAFHELDAKGTVVTSLDIAHLTGVSESRVCAILRTAPFYTPQHRRAARQQGARKGRAAQAALGYPGLRKAWATDAARGYPKLRKGWDTQRSLGYPGLRKAWATQAAAGFPNLRKGLETNTAAGFPNLRKGVRSLSLKHKGVSLAPTHPIVLQGTRTRLRILALLRELCQSSADAPMQVAIVERLGMSAAGVHKHIRRMRADGWIDEHNRPIDGAAPSGAA